MKPWRDPRVRRALDVALWMLVLGMLVWRFGPQATAALGIRAGGEGEAPPLAVTTLAGEHLSLGDLRGRVVVVNFWASWCAPCRLEMPGFERAWQSRRDQGLVVLGLSTDATEADALAFVERAGVTYPVAMVGRRETDAFGGVRGLPATLLIDRSGRVRHRVVGFYAEPLLKQAVDRLLAEAPPAPVR